MSEAASDRPTPESSDAVLITRIRAGDVTAYGTLYERHLGAARGLARQLVDHHAAEEAVQETFAKVLDAIRRGGGPRTAFRPYLLTALRHTIYDRRRGEHRTEPTARIEEYDRGAPFADPALEELERAMVVRAFRSLPERWQAVLWHTEIERAKPAEVAPILGLTANGVSALAYRAREGLRQAYLQMHLADPPAPSSGPPPGASSGPSSGAGAGAGTGPGERCRPVLEKLGPYVRGGLALRDARKVRRHLDGCERCRDVHTELADVNTALREAVGPLLLGTATTAYVASKGGLTLGGILGPLQGLFQSLLNPHHHVGVASTAATGLVLVTMIVVTSDGTTIPSVTASPGAGRPAATSSPDRTPGGHLRPEPGPPASPSPSPGPVLGTPQPTVSGGPEGPDTACPADPHRNGRGPVGRGGGPGDGAWRGAPYGRCGHPSHRGPNGRGHANPPGYGRGDGNGRGPEHRHGTGRPGKPGKGGKGGHPKAGVSPERPSAPPGHSRPHPGRHGDRPHKR
ncbi:sigma-70 family RNA polymerase sigma factor [Actinomadura viridis]|uniref:sigma-70 family RNA polymerase sigma factor n=1 Tax=Actinomadura viridis TaxID=58110 RepID=UPI0036C9F049